MRTKYLSLTVITAVVLWIALVAAWVTLGPNGLIRRPATATRASSSQRTGFSHDYPPDPANVERPPVAPGAPVAPAKNRVDNAVKVTSFVALAHLLPSGVLRPAATGWLLTAPAEIDGPMKLTIKGPAQLAIAPEAFLIVAKKARVSLTNTTIVGVDAKGLPMDTPQPTRGFVEVRQGGRLQLSDDHLLYLGHLGDEAYGLALDGPGPTTVIGCTIQGLYFGVYMSRAKGVRIEQNQVLNSVVYGIDPHSSSSDLMILRNVVTGSGVHGIILADHVTRTQVVGNTVKGSRDHGIVVYQYSDHNVIRGNHVASTFDGIVIQDSSSNLIDSNTVGPVTRFGLRISGLSNRNIVQRNTFSNALLGAYLYQGPTGNQLIDNVFINDQEYVRVRKDAPGNTVTPTPPHSELVSA